MVQDAAFCLNISKFELLSRVCSISYYLCALIPLENPTYHFHPVKMKWVILETSLVEYDKTSVTSHHGNHIDSYHDQRFKIRSHSSCWHSTAIYATIRDPSSARTKFSDHCEGVELSLLNLSNSPIEGEPVRRYFRSAQRSYRN